MGDLDVDGNDDVIIGAPGCNSSSGVQDGAVFIVFGEYLLNCRINKVLDIRCTKN